MRCEGVCGGVWLKRSTESPRASLGDVGRYPPQVYIANLCTQAGQTDGMTLEEHVSAVEAAIGCPLDYVVCNSGVPPPTARPASASSECAPPGAVAARSAAAAAESDEATMLHVTAALRGHARPRVLEGNIVAAGAPRAEWEKAPSPKHDPARLAAIVRNLCEVRARAHAVVVVRRRRRRMPQGRTRAAARCLRAQLEAGRVRAARAAAAAAASSSSSGGGTGPMPAAAAVPTAGGARPLRVSCSDDALHGLQRR